MLDAWSDTFKGYAGAVFDESDMAKNPQAARTKAAIRLSEKIVDPMAVRLCLTGTPFRNDVTEVIPQLRILRRMQDFGGTTAEFRRRYRGRSGALLLNKALRSTCYVRRLKVDVLPDLPEKRWAPFEVEGDPGWMEVYRKAEADLITYLAEQAERFARDAGADNEEARAAAVRAGFKASQAEHLVAISTLRQLAAKAKVPAIRQWLETFQGSGKKVITFGWHREIVDMVADDFAGGLKIQGGMTSEKRQAVVDRFQTDDDAMVVSCQIVAAGVAITLTAASDVLFIEQGWTPRDMDQAIDRAHRIGQTDSVTGWVPMIPDTIDEDMAAIIARKRVIVNAAADGVDVDEEAAGAVTELLTRLAKKGRTKIV